MAKHNLSFPYLIILLLLISFSNNQPTKDDLPKKKPCKCPIYQPPSPGYIPPLPSSFTIQPETINTILYGLPVIFGKSVFHIKDFTPIPTSILSIPDPCPAGYRLPTIVEYQQLLNTIASQGDLYTEIQKADGFKGIPGKTYISSTKTFAGKIEGNDPESYEFQGFTIDEDEQKVFIESKSTWTLGSTNDLIGRCILGSIAYNEAIDKDFDYGLEYDLTISNMNIGDSVIHYQSDTITTPNPTSKFTWKRMGCQLLQSWLRNCAGEIMYRCDKVYINYRLGNDGNVATPSNALSISKITPGFIAKHHPKLFNEYTFASIAPKQQGGFYILYLDTTITIHVVEYDITFNMIKQETLATKAYPFDICALPEGGFVIYARNAIDKNFSFISFYDKEFKEIYRKSIMNNLVAPQAPRNQITFYDSHAEIIPGFELMTDPRNGRLVYGKEKVGLIFQHENDFKTSYGNEHKLYGDTIMVFDPYTEPTYSISWVATPSLEQYHIYNGRFYISASLSNKSPQNIRICVTDMITITDHYDAFNHHYLKQPGQCSDLLEYAPANTNPDDDTSLPGDKDGNSCGRLGGIVNLGSEFAVVYTRKFCKSNKGILKNRLVLIRFNINDSTMKVESKRYNSIEAAEIDNLVNVKIGKYGDKILIILYITPPLPIPPDPTLIPPTKPNEALPVNEYKYDEVTHYLYADIATGDFIPPNPASAPPVPPAPPLPLPVLNMYPGTDFGITNEPLRVLKQGELIWPSVDPLTGSITIHYTTNLPAPITNSSDETPGPIEEEDVELKTVPLSASTLHFSYALLLLISILSLS